MVLEKGNCRGGPKKVGEGPFICRRIIGNQRENYIPLRSLINTVGKRGFDEGGEKEWRGPIKKGTSGLIT